jgi:hypothetical protein
MHPPPALAPTRPTPFAARRLPLAPDWLFVGVRFLLAAGLRVWGVQWALPYVIHVDEPKIVDAGVRIVKSGDLNPHLFIWPSLVIYLQAAIYQLNLLWGTWRGIYSGPESLPDSNHILALAPDLYLWGRTFSALVGGAAVAGVYGLGRAIFGRGAGLVAALLLLTSPLHVEYSHYLVTDVTMGALGLAVLAASWRLATRPTPRVALLAGALVGLCAAAKYNGVYIALVPAIAVILDFRFWILGESRRDEQEARDDTGNTHPKSKIQNLKWLAAMIVGAAMVFLIANPYLILDWPDWSRGFLFQVNDYKPAATLGDMLVSFGNQVRDLWRTDPAILASGGLGGLALLIEAIARRGQPGDRGRAAALLLPFPLVYAALMARFDETFERNLIITLPFLCLLGGYLIADWGVRSADWLAGLISRGQAGRLQSALRTPQSAIVLAGLLGLALVAEPGRQMINFDRYMAAPDSRNQAAAWLLDELRAGRRAAVELHPWLLCAPPPWACPAPDLYAPLAPLTQQPPAWYAERGYDYVVLVGKAIAVLEDPSVSGPRPPAALAPYLALPEVRHFAGDDEGGKGPPVLVLRVGPGVTALKGVTHNGARFGDLAELWGTARAPLATAAEPFDPVTTPPPPADTPYHPGAAIGLNLYWRALRDGAAVPGNWTVAVHLVDGAGATVAQVDVPPISNGRLRPAREWRAGEFLAGTYNVPLPPTLPPGTYHLTVILYDAPNGPTLPVSSGGAAPTPALDLGPITVTP